MFLLIIIMLSLLLTLFTLVEWNCENLFDCIDDSLTADEEFTPEGAYHWTYGHYWRKLNRVGQVIVGCGGEGRQWQLPDFVALCEVESDTVLTDLTRKSLLRNASYEYVMTHSPDRRGINVAFLYSPFSFLLTRSYSLRVDTLPGMKPTRDILYVCGATIDDDTLHFFVVHAPSRSGGEHATRPYRHRVAERLCQSIDSIRAVHPDAHIIVTGDFNDYSSDKNLLYYAQHDLVEVSRDARGSHGAKGTYRYQGLWDSLDHVFMSRQLARRTEQCFVFDAPYLMEDDTRYGGFHPKRNYRGTAWVNGFSDHLPLVTRFNLSSE